MNVGARARGYALWEVIDGSRLVLRGRIASLDSPATARLAIAAVLRGAHALDEIHVQAPDAIYPEIVAPDWAEGEEAIVALLDGAAPYYPVGGPYGIVSLRKDREALIATVEDMVRVCDPDRPPSDRAAGLAALLVRPFVPSQNAGLIAVREYPRARPLLDDAAVAAAIVSLTRSDDWIIRRDASWACERLLREAVLDALIDRLEDEEKWVRNAAASVLQGLTDQDLGYVADGDPDRRAIAVFRWRRWRRSFPTSVG